MLITSHLKDNFWIKVHHNISIIRHIIYVYLIFDAQFYSIWKKLHFDAHH